MSHPPSVCVCVCLFVSLFFLKATLALRELKSSARFSSNFSLTFSLFQSCQTTTICSRAKTLVRSMKRKLDTLWPNSTLSLCFLLRRQAKDLPSFATLLFVSLCAQTQNKHKLELAQHPALNSQLALGLKTLCYQSCSAHATYKLATFASAT